MHRIIHNLKNQYFITIWRSGLVKCRKLSKSFWSNFTFPNLAINLAIQTPIFQGLFSQVLSLIRKRAFTQSTVACVLSKVFAKTQLKTLRPFALFDSSFISSIQFFVSFGGINLTTKFQSIRTTLLWNNVLWLAKICHMTFNNQL